MNNDISIGVLPRPLTLPPTFTARHTRNDTHSITIRAHWKTRYRGAPVLLRVVFANCLERETVTKDEYMAKIAEVDQLLNDPTVSLNPMRIWALLSELAGAIPFDVGFHDEYASAARSVVPRERS